MAEEVQKDDGAKTVNNVVTSIPSSPYSNIKREISEADLSSPALQRILLSENDKLENRNLELENILSTTNVGFNYIKDKYHEKDKEHAIIVEKLKSYKSLEILYTLCLTSGSIIIGFAKSVSETGYSGLFLGIGILLIIGGITSKTVKWN